MPKGNTHHLNHITSPPVTFCIWVLVTFFTRRDLATLSVRGCVVISNNRKFCFSVVRTPFSTRFLASLSRTFFSWYLSFNGFHVSPAIILTPYLISDKFQNTVKEHVEIKCQLDTTAVFTADLVACSTCFGHHYAHHQELKSIIQWLLPVVFRTVVFKLLVWCAADGYAAAPCKLET